MTREQLIEVMAKAECLHDDPKCNWEALPERHKDSYRESQAAILDALTAAGMVVVPREPTGEMLEAGRKAWKKPRLHVNYNPADELMTCGVIYRAMTEAANG